LVSEVRFLTAIWREALGVRGLYGELRFIRSCVSRDAMRGRGEIAQVWVDLGELGLHGLEEIAIRNEDGWDAYYGVQPRIGRNGTANATSPLVSTLWADLDGKDFVGGKEEALSALVPLIPGPAIIVDSGHGYHAYWLLDREIAWSVAHDLMKGIAQAVNGDSVYDAARVMRIPGTLNWKGELPTTARLLRFRSEDRVRPDTLYRYLLRKEEKPPHKDIPHSSANLPEWLLDLLALGARPGERSEACFKAAIWLYRYGRTDEEVRDAFRAYPQGIGAKYYEKGRDGERWLAYTLKAAKEVA